MNALELIKFFGHSSVYGEIKFADLETAKVCYHSEI